MSIEKQITNGASKAIAAMEKISGNDPHLAIAQLLLAAAALSKMTDVGESEFVRCCDLARAEIYDDSEFEH